MSTPTQSSESVRESGGDFGLDADRVTPPAAFGEVIRRRFGGRYLVDPFGFDPQLADTLAPVVDATLRIDVEGDEHIPSRGPGALIVNRGLGFAEPTAVALAVRRGVGRRLRVVGLPGLPFADGLARRFGAIAGTAEDVTPALRAGHLVLVPLAPTWLRSGAGTCPLAIVQALLPYPVLPVAVKASGPLGAPTRWSVRIGEPVDFDHTYTVDDPLAAAEVGETVRANVERLLGRSVA
jgi:1-acyl-sn-glycerol-3-phosphate acyltransferase